MKLRTSFWGVNTVRVFERVPKLHAKRNPVSLKIRRNLYFKLSNRWPTVCRRWKEWL